MDKLAEEELAALCWEVHAIASRALSLKERVDALNKLLGPHGMMARADTDRVGMPYVFLEGRRDAVDRFRAAQDSIRARLALAL